MRMAWIFCFHFVYIRWNTPGVYVSIIPEFRESSVVVAEITTCTEGFSIEKPQP